MTREVTVHLGSELDEALHGRLLDVLRGLGARTEDGSSYSVAGSQEIQSVDLVIEGQSLRVQRETYVGLSISGPEDLVQGIREDVQNAG